MARPLRIDIENGWYHVTARGIDRNAIFYERRDREHFLEVLSSMVERFSVILHSYILLDNHWHAIIQTPEANLSRAVQWLNVSYSVWFNRKHDRVGPLYQGRFKSIPVENSAWAYELSLYVHLNPVMRRERGLDKRSRKAESKGFTVPDKKEVTRRLAELRGYEWSSYRAYAGYVRVPDWLETKDILVRAARKEEQRIAAYRQDVKQRLSKGVPEEFGERLRSGFALGAAEFIGQVKEMAGLAGRELSHKRTVRRRVEYEEIVRWVEDLRGESSEAFLTRRGDRGIGLVLWGARSFCGMTLREIGRAVGGKDYAAVGMAIKRFLQRAEKSRRLRGEMKRLREYVTANRSGDVNSNGNVEC